MREKSGSRLKSILVSALLILAPFAAEAQLRPQFGASPDLSPAHDSDRGLSGLMMAAPEEPGSNAVRAFDVLFPETRQQEEPSFWRHLLIGTGVGVALGFVHGWSADRGQSSVGSQNSFWNFQSDYYYRIWHSVIGGAVGGASGATIYFIRR